MYVDRDSYRRIVENIRDGLYFVDRHRIIRYWNKAAEAISGYTAAEVVGKSCADNILTHIDKDGSCLCKGMCPLAKTIADGQIREAEIFMHHRDGHRMLISVRVETLTDGNGRVIGGAELFSDMSAFRSVQLRMKELEEMAYLDSLTKLANRTYIERELSIRFEEQKRFGAAFGILFMDIDHFKEFNDRYGHDVGDRVLKFVANTLISNARPFDLLGRWGGEEFVGILRKVTYPQLEQLGNRLRVLVENSHIILDGHKLHVTISVGATLTRDGESAYTLLRRADELLYESKRAGRNRLTIG